MWPVKASPNVRSAASVRASRIATLPADERHDAAPVARREHRRCLLVGLDYGSHENGAPRADLGTTVRVEAPHLGSLGRGFVKRDELALVGRERHAVNPAHRVEPRELAPRAQVNDVRVVRAERDARARAIEHQRRAAPQLVELSPGPHGGASRARVDEVETPGSSPSSRASGRRG